MWKPCSGHTESMTFSNVCSRIRLGQWIAYSKSINHKNVLPPLFIKQLISPVYSKLCGYHFSFLSGYWAVATFLVWRPIFFFFRFTSFVVVCNPLIYGFSNKLYRVGCLYVMKSCGAFFCCKTIPVPERLGKFQHCYLSYFVWSCVSTSAYRVCFVSREAVFVWCGVRMSCVRSGSKYRLKSRSENENYHQRK